MLGHRRQPPPGHKDTKGMGQRRTRVTEAQERSEVRRKPGNESLQGKPAFFNAKQPGGGEIDHAIGAENCRGDQDRPVVAKGELDRPTGGRRERGGKPEFGDQGSGNPVRPMRRFNVRRRRANSTHPATPAEAVSPAMPQCASRPSQRGRGMAHKYPRAVVSETRTTA